MKNSNQARLDALEIWHAGVDAVRSDALVRNRLAIDDGALHCDQTSIDLKEIDRIIVVGAGKAGAGMAVGLEQVFAESKFADTPITGWVNVPADCVRPLSHIHLHAARPAGRNEPTAAGVEGSKNILQLVQSATERDLVICLISGGGSALLPLPVDGVTWQDKRAITRLLSDAGADIRQLNTVRKQLSAIKGGGLARACPRAPLLTLILSDVIGDPLEAIASGPTVPNTTTVDDAIAVLEQFIPDRNKIPASVRRHFNAERARGRSRNNCPMSPLPDGERLGEGRIKTASYFSNVPTPPSETGHVSNVTNIILGNNQTAVNAAGAHAEALGYRVVVLPTQVDEGTAEDVAVRLLAAAQEQPAGTCIVSGGEPTVRLVDPEFRGTGGRNQQLVLAALVQLLDCAPSQSSPTEVPTERGLTLISGGTDGEDGPTDAAGAILDNALLKRTRASNVDPRMYLRKNDAYRFFAEHDALLFTGPTNTNVCDLRIVTI